MSSAAFALIVNLCVALMFAAAFFGIWMRGRDLSGVWWFGLSYAVGAITPLSELLIRVAPDTPLFVASSYVSFSLALHLMAWGLAVYWRRSLPAAVVVCSFLASIALRAAIWGGVRDTLPYEFAYQLPFAVVTGLCAALILPRATGWLHHLLGAMFAIVCAHFLLKPYAAFALGSGATASDYMTSAYALVSQSLTGILLAATALALLAVVVNDLLGRASADAETDPLSGLLNRRGFDRRATQLVAARGTRPVAAAAFDLDHFKRFNDRYGHAVGDDLIARFAAALRAAAPPDSIIARTGGEEFAVVLPGMHAAGARLFAEAVRMSMRSVALDQLPGTAVTASAGVTAMQAGETLSALMVRVDGLLYRAKQSGRDRVVTDDAAGQAERPVIPRLAGSSAPRR